MIMKRTIAWSIVLLASLSTATARPERLRFSGDGTFRIVQFTDTHLDARTPERVAEAEKTFARIDRTIRTEHPDLIVFTGDVVTGRPAAGMWQRLLDTLVRRGVPYCIVLGNHDAEQDLPRTGDSAAGHIGQGEPQHARGVGRVGGCRAAGLRIGNPGACRRALLPRFTRLLDAGGDQRIRLVPSGTDRMAAAKAAKPARRPTTA